MAMGVVEREADASWCRCHNCTNCSGVKNGRNLNNVHE
jgi:hypothetical protein